jgi:hypothetical protein
MWKSQCMYSVLNPKLRLLHGLEKDSECSMLKLSLMEPGFFNNSKTSFQNLYNTLLITCKIILDFMNLYNIVLNF